MSLAHAILGLLTIQPMTGYDLKQQAFDRTISHFWQADQSQIYRTLNRMADNGWVESSIEYQDERPNRRVYAITDSGIAELQRWLHTEQSLPAHREAFLIQLFFANRLPDPVILSHIQNQVADRQKRLAQYDDINLPELDSPEISRQQVFWRLTLELGIALEKTYLDWLQTCQQTIQSLEKPDEQTGSDNTADEGSIIEN